MHETRSHVRRGLKSSWPADGRVRAYWIWAVCIFLLLAVTLVFGQTLGHEFLAYDDDGFVYTNPHVTPGLTLAGLWYAVSDGPYGEWCPLTTLSHQLDCQVYGLNAAGHYLTNVLLHAASSVLLFLVLLRMTGGLWPSAWVAAIFAIHPLHVESVAWIAERRDVLSGLFFMLTFGAYALYAEPVARAYLTVVGCFALGLTAKPMLVTVPFLLLLLDYWPLDRFRRESGTISRSGTESGSWLSRLPVHWRLVVEKIPLISLAAISCGIVLLSHASLRANDQVERLSLAPRLANALIAYVAYLGQSFFPVDLCAYYPHRGTQLPIAWVAGSLALLVAITAVALFFWRRLPYLVVGWLWFLGMLVPVIGLVGAFIQARADRYTYLSQIGLSIALAWGVWSVYRSRQSLQAARWRRWTLAAVSGAAVLALTAVAWRQTSYWRNFESVWARSAACTDHNLVAHYNLAFLSIQQGKTDEGIAHLREAIAARSLYRQMLASAHDLLADQLMLQGKVDEAFTHYEQAVRAFPSSELPRVRLAAELTRAGRHAQAIAEWREAVRLAPSSLEARLGFANALLDQGATREAADQCRAALKGKPDSIEAIVVLGTALTALGQVEDAVANFERALTLDPSDARPHFLLGRIHYDRGQSGIAKAYFEDAIRLCATISKSCVRWPGFWRRAPIPRYAMEREPSNWPAGRSSFPEAKTCTPSMPSPPRWPKPTNSPRRSTRPRRRRRWPCCATTRRWSTPLTLGLASTNTACRIASRQRLSRLSTRHQTLLSKCAGSARSILRRLLGHHRLAAGC